MEKLYKYQEKFLAKGLDKSFVLWPCGRGKSRVACEWAKKKGGTTLVVTTKGLQINWSRQIEMWGLTADIVSKENFKKGVKHYDNLIVDEADFFLAANFSSQLSKSLRNYLVAHHPRLCMMSATMYRSSPMNVYSAAVLLGHRWHYREFQYKFFNQVRMGLRIITVAKKDKATQAKLRDLIESISEVISPEDDFDIPLHTFETVYVDEDAGQKKKKKENFELHPMSRFTVNHRAESLNQNKFEAVLRLCQENKKTIVVCRFIEQMVEIEKFLEAEKFKCFKIWGGNEGRQETVDAAESAEECVVLIQNDTVQGYELPSFRTMVFASQAYSMYSHTQVIGRNDRVNALAKNTYIYLLAGEADKAVHDSIQKNQDFDPIIYYKNHPNE